MAILAAAVGGYVHIFNNIVEAGFLTGIANFISFFWLVYISQNNGEKNNNPTMRLLLFGISSFLCGFNLGPLLNLAIAVNPALVSVYIHYKNS